MSHYPYERTYYSCPSLALAVRWSMHQIKSSDTAGKVNDTTAAEPAAAATPTQSAPAYQAVSPADADAEQVIFGPTVGAFGDNKITLLITKAAGNAISGRSVVGGNDRPFRRQTYGGEWCLTRSSPMSRAIIRTTAFSSSLSSARPEQGHGHMESQRYKTSRKMYTLDRTQIRISCQTSASGPQASTRC